MSVGPISTSSAYAGVPGAAGNSSVAGFDALGIKGNGKPANPAPTNSGSNVYQSAYDGIVSASNDYLQRSLINGNPTQQIPLYAAGSSANAFALLQSTLAAISTGLHAGLFQGTGFNALA